MIGIMITPRKLSRFMAGKNYYEFDQYIQFATACMIDICFFTLEDLHFEDLTVQGYVFTPQQRTLTVQTVPIPPVNLIRTVQYILDTKTVRALNTLTDQWDIKFLNMVTNRERNKYENQLYLQQFAEVHKYLPPIAPLSWSHLLDFLHEYQKIFIKPRRGLQGRDITMMIKEGDQFHIWTEAGDCKQCVSYPELKEIYQNTFRKPGKYFIQKAIELKEYQGKKFDIRASVQKNRNEQWQVTGMAVRCAKKGRILTNITKGGKPLAVDGVLPDQTFLRKEIEVACIKIAEALEQRYSYNTDLGIDMAVDQHNQIWFLETNFCAQRKSYRRIGDDQTRKAVYLVPIEYAYTLYQKID